MPTVTGSALSALRSAEGRDALDVLRLRAVLCRAGVGGDVGGGLGVGGLGDCGTGGMWSDIRVVGSTGSTNADVLAQAARGAPEGLVIVAEAQTAGRGRQGRSWISRPGAALTFSALLRPREVPQAARGWVPLLAGVATVSALRDMAVLCAPDSGGADFGAPGIDARLKWPNDIMIGEKKLGGILAEQSGDAIVVGVGINVLGAEPDLPVPTATSLESHRVGQIDRTNLLVGILRQLERWYLAWRTTCATGAGAARVAASGAGAGSASVVGVAVGGAGVGDVGAGGAGVGGADATACGLRAEYLRHSATVGQQVRVHLPGSRVLAGTATDIDEAGCLLVRADDGHTHAISASDVIHLR